MQYDWTLKFSNSDCSSNHCFLIISCAVRLSSGISWLKDLQYDWALNFYNYKLRSNIGIWCILIISYAVRLGPGQVLEPLGPFMYDLSLIHYIMSPTHRFRSDWSSSDITTLSQPVTFMLLCCWFRIGCRLLLVFYHF